MQFRPCIDIHNGKVKQIIGGSLKDQEDRAEENFVAEQDAEFYARFYKEQGLKGGHVILLNAPDSVFYEQSRQQAVKALQAYEGGLQIGGGITDENAAEYISRGASHVIVTSFVFQKGEIHYENLKKIVNKVGRDRLVLDLSCRKKGDSYFIVTDRWQKFTRVEISKSVLEELSSYCSEFLIHAVDVEGKARGIEEELAVLLGKWQRIPVTYAGGVGSLQDLEKLKCLGRNHLDVTVGSALDLFGGNLEFERVLQFCSE